MTRLLDNARRTGALAAAAAALAVLVAGAAGAGTRTPLFAATGTVEGRISVVADFNADGKPDLGFVRPGRISCAVDSFEKCKRDHKLVVISAKIRVLLGDGAGVFAVAPGPLLDAGGLTIAVPNSVPTAAVAAGDFNGDGKTDLAVANRAQTDPFGKEDVAGTNDVRVFVGNGAGGFAAAPPHALGSGHPWALTVADLNGDGKDDLLVPVDTVSAIASRAVALSRTWLVVQSPLTLDLYNAATGKKAKSLALGSVATPELAGANSKLALLRGGERSVLVFLSNGKLILLPLHDAVDSTLTEAGLFYAYNTPGAAMKGHIVFEPTAMLLRRF